MLKYGDKIALGVSGGKDSLSLLHAMVAYRKRAPFPYELVAVTLEQGKFKLPIRALEEKGIGRPSTYAAIMSTVSVILLSWVRPESRPVTDADSRADVPDAPASPSPSTARTYERVKPSVVTLEGVGAHLAIAGSDHAHARIPRRRCRNPPAAPRRPPWNNAPSERLRSGWW